MNKIIHIINHDTEETFQIVGLENFLEWLNDNDLIYSFSLDDKQVIEQLKGL